MRRVLPVVAAAMILASCGGESGIRGGEQELALAAATTAVDVAKVTALLRAGADPNKSVRVSGTDQSPWFLALTQLRPKRPDMVEVIVAMLKAGANPDAAWGTGGGTRPPESLWRRLRRSRADSTGQDSPLRLVMMHPSAEAVRAIASASGFDPRSGEAALVSAVETGELEIVHILVDAGVDVNCHPGANTPLVAAIESRNVALMTYLEDHGARENP